MNNKKYKVDYDNIADTLYITSKSKDIHSFIDDNYIIVLKKESSIYGITITDYKDRHKDKSWNDKLILAYFPDFDLKLLEKIKDK